MTGQKTKRAKPIDVTWITDPDQMHEIVQDGPYSILTGKNLRQNLSDSSKKPNTRWAKVRSVKNSHNPEKHGAKA